MAKKPKKKPIVVKEKSLEQKEKALRKEMLISAAIITVVLFYVLCSYACYASYHPRESLSEQMIGTMNEVSENPLYMFPINYSLAVPFGLIVCVYAFMIIDYINRKIRIQSNTNTIKGRTQWADVDDIVSRYATWGGRGRYSDYKNQFKTYRYPKTPICHWIHTCISIT